MKYIIMCGGTFPEFETPRQLVPFLGEPLAARTIRLLRENGVEDISISSNSSAFLGLGVPVLHHKNDYTSRGYNQGNGLWCEAFYPTDEPTCYLLGDVCFSPAAIKTIVEYEGEDIAFFASAPPFSPDYPKAWVEPFAFKVWDTEHLHQAVRDVKRLNEWGRFKREPISWEVWNVILRGPDGDVNTIDYDSYVRINDWTSDIDHPYEVENLEAVARCG